MLTMPNRAGAPAVALLALLVLASCRSGRPVAEISQGTLPTTPTTAVPTTTTSTPAPTSTSTTAQPAAAVAPAPPPGLGPGARGPQVLALEQRLDSLRFDVGKVDEVYDGVTAHAVTAFQKVAGMARNGRATDDVIAALNNAGPPTALVPGGGPTRVEVYLPTQVLFLYEGNQLSKILPVSSGNNKRFCSEGWCRKAVTPTGAFYVHRKARGWEKSPLGRLYNSQYIVDGIAIHGSPSVPAYPASHGCIRIPMNAAEWFPDRVPLGTPVYVIGAGETPAPLPPSTVPPPTAPPVTSPPIEMPPSIAPVPTTTSTLVPLPLLPTAPVPQ